MRKINTARKIGKFTVQFTYSEADNVIDVIYPEYVQRRLHIITVYIQDCTMRTMLLGVSMFSRKFAQVSVKLIIFEFV